jgi:hypothetical protein
MRARLGKNLNNKSLNLLNTILTWIFFNKYNINIA